MDSSDESDNDDISMLKLESVITEMEARKNYEQAGNLVAEDKDPISIENHEHLLEANSEAVLDSVLKKLALPYSLTDFQKLSLITLFQKKDLILCSPTGSGKTLAQLCTVLFTSGNVT